MSRAATGRAFALLSAIFYSTRPVLVRFGLMTGVGVPALVALRMVFAAAVFLLAETVTGDPRAGWRLCRDRRMIAGAACFSGALIFSFYAVSLIGVSLTALIIFSHPVFVALLGRIVHKERLGAVRGFALAFSYGGCMLMTGLVGGRGAAVGEATLPGAALALSAALLYAVYQLLTQEIARTRSTLSIGAATAYLSLVPALALWHFDPLEMPWEAVAIGAGMGLFSTFLPIVFLVAAIERIGATGTSQLSVAGPLSAVVMGWAFFGETLSPVQWVGAGVLLGSVSLLLLHRNR